MKRIIKIICAAFFIIFMPVSLAVGQGSKSEQKIKITVDDGSGTKITIDTLIKDGPGPDSLKLSNGSVVYLRHRGDGSERHHKYKGNDHVFVTYSSNGNDDGKEYTEVTVISSDSAELASPGDGNNVKYYTRSDRHEGRGGQKYKVITRDYKGNGDKGETINIYADNDNDSTMDKCKYVIAKDGMVVTVEGNDEARAKALVKEIESSLGVKSDGTEKKETIKVESKKTIKK
jgi:hypothetical protein